ncbi:MAG TPA: hypothetical protein VFO65_12545, partial [Acidimicrobiales bacterium]|nr:hypothetical protein [Acidimicrobiales bacterium]
EEPLAAHFRPVQPKVTLDVTAADGLRAHGVLVESLVSEDVAGVDAVYARPTIDLGAHEPERSATKVWFPAQVQALHSAATPTGRADRLVVMPGQYTTDGSAPGTQRLHRRVEGTVYRSDSDDWWAPHITSVRGRVVNGGATFEVRTPAVDVVRGVVLWRDDRTGGAWNRSELLAGGPGRWSAGTLLTAGATMVEEFTVQLVDAAGNVAASTNKGPGYVARAETSGSDGLTVGLSPAPGPSGYAPGPVTVTVGGIPVGHTASVTVDGGEPFTYTAPFAVAGDGLHLVEAVLDDGSRSAVQPVAIDTTPPVAGAAVTPEPNAAGWHSGPVSVTFECSDATSGVASCPAPVTLAGDGAGQTVTRTVTDRLGLSTTVVAGPVSIDRTAPVISASVVSTPGANGWLRAATVRFTCSDATSGVADCPADVVVPDGDGQSVSGTAVDVAGNSTTVTLTGLRVDAGAPTLSASISPSPNAHGWNRSDTTVDFTCADAVSGVATCTGDRTVTGETDGVAVVGAATDTAGNTASVTVTVRIDRTAPGTRIDRPRQGVVNFGQGVTGRSSDARSGVAFVTLSYTPHVVGDGPGTVTRIIACPSAGDCRWNDPDPPPGLYTITAVATDRAGNEEPVTNDNRLFSVVIY